MLVRVRLILLAGVVACLATACTAIPATAPAANVKTGTAGAATATARPRGAASSPSPTPKPKPRPPAPHVRTYRVRASDGAVVTVAVFRGPVRYRLHNGSEDPGYAATVAGVKAGSAVGGTERKHLLAAFNGGFKLGVGAGGYEQEGHVISPLLKGYASLIIDRSGRARIGVWGYGAPARGEAVYSVRQNLQPLVEHGKPTQAAYDWYVWGATLGGGELVARSALGQDGHGAGHQPGVGTAGRRVPAGWLAAGRGTWPVPSGEPVHRRLEPGLHHRAGRLTQHHRILTRRITSHAEPLNRLCIRFVFSLYRNPSR
jgi:hypothetical protein